MRRAWHTEHVGADESELRVAWQRHVGRGPAADGWFETVLADHREPHRHYHDLRHVAWVSRHARALAAADPVLPEPDLDRVIAAAFFHDVVYEATRTDNEDASAAVARRALGEIGWGPAAVEHVAAMIAATAGHTVDMPDDHPSDRCTAVLLAADLGVLAADPAGYGDYVRGVRQEYGHLADPEWRAGRAAFVRSMLERPSIYPAELGLHRWERRARANLTAELATLG